MPKTVYSWRLFYLQELQQVETGHDFTFLLVPYKTNAEFNFP